MYILLNRNDIVVDILSMIRYIKLQSSNGITVACEEHEGTGVIGSDCDTHYVLIKSDTTSSPNAVRVVKFENEKIPSNIRPGYWKLDNETGTLVRRYTLEEAQAMKQEENKVLFADYLASHPMTWVDGKEYGITEADQAEISLNLTQYSLAVSAGEQQPTLEWHARHEECSPWPVEKMTALSLAISKAVYPQYHKMQQFKTAIYACATHEELEAIEINYEEEEANVAE